MSQRSFDIDINGIKFTLAPVGVDNGESQQYSVMTADHIFRMNHDDDTRTFKIADKEALPEEISELEQYLSNAILDNEAPGKVE